MKTCSFLTYTKCCVLLFAFAFISNKAIAKTFYYFGVYYTTTSETTASVYDIPDSYDKNITIPATVGDNSGCYYLVTGVSSNAFSGCKLLKTVSLPSDVEYIGSNAFYDCWDLQSITFRGNNSLKTIGRYAFYNCDDLETISIPNSVTNIEEKAFIYCDGLKNVTLSNSLSSISTGLFYDCPNLTNITIPESVKSIGFSAFYECTSLCNIEIPNSVTTIGGYAFYRCSSLNSIIIPSSVQEIGKQAFYNCVQLSSVTLGDSVASIGEQAFVGCGLSNIVCKAHNPPTISQNTFSESTYTNASLKVLPTLINQYRTTNYWNKFYHIMVDGVLATSVSLDVSSASLYRNETILLNAKVLPDYAIYKVVTWTSSNPSVAIVSSDGLVTAKSPGNTEIIVKTDDGSNLSATCSVVVKQRMATSISLNQAAATMYTNESLQLSATVLPDNADDKTVTWSSSDPVVATVSSTGLVTAKSTGDAVITAKTSDGSNLSASCSLTVKQLATSISLNDTSATIYTGNTLQLNATVLPSTTSNPSVTWTSSNTSIATVSSTGLVTAKSTGDAVITAKTTDGSNLSAMCNLTVKQLATSISLNETTATLYTGNIFQLNATVLPSTTSNPNVIWTSSNTSVAIVSSTGLVTAKSTGDAVITARTTDGSNLSASCSVTVKRLATSISLNQTSATLYLNQTIQLTATVSPYNATDKSVVWSSFDSSIATVSENGLVTAIAPGYTTITATTVDGSNLSATCEITVKAYVTSLTLDQSNVIILEGDTILLTPTILPTYATNQNINWSSNNTGVATVNNGVVVGRSGGETTITARTSDGSNLSATCKVTVIPNFDLTMANLSHIRGSSDRRFDLTIDLSNRYDITGMQFDIQLPDGVTIAKDNNGEYDIWPDDLRKSRNHTATASLISGNTYRILVSSATANSLKGHSGTVLHIMIEIPISHVSGNKQVKYSNIILSEPDETRHTLPTMYSTISYYYKEGDANADVNVDVADYVITGNYILQNGPENFWYDAANVDHNSTIDVNDLTGITNIALGRREGGILQMPAMQAPEDNQDIELTANPLVIQAGQTKTMNLSLEGLRSFAGFQMDVQLPKGIKLTGASLADGNSDLSMATAELPDGSIRLLASSFSLKSLSVSKSAFLKLTLTAESSFYGNDIITLDNVKFSERNMDLHTLDNVVIPVGSDVSGFEQVYSVIRIYAEDNNIIIDTPESGTARIITISGINQVRDVIPGHNVIPMEDSGFYIVTLNGTTEKLRLN